MTDKKPVRIAVTGSAGNIAYALLFRIASGQMLGSDQPVILHLLEITPMLKALDSVRMELNDSAFNLVKDIVVTDDLNVGFRDVDYALLVGSRPRSKGMERRDLIEANGAIFQTQGRALNEHASRDVRVIVVGNPANTNAMIAMHNAPDLAPEQFSSMMRLDHNRTLHQISKKTGVEISDIKRVTVWGNHTMTMFPDISQVLVRDKPVVEMVDMDWYRNEMVPIVQKRGASIIEARGMSSAASAASALLDAGHSLCCGTPEGDWTSMSVASDGSYGVSEGLFHSFPVTISNGEYRIVQGLEFDEFGQQMMAVTLKELQDERDAVRHLLP